MSALAQPSGRRAPRFPKSLARRRNLLVIPKRPATQDLRLQLAFAHDVGYARGLADKHHEDRNFATGAEWLAWLAGWREGQRDLAEKQRIETRELAMKEKALRRLL